MTGELGEHRMGASGMVAEPVTAEQGGVLHQAGPVSGMPVGASSQRGDLVGDRGSVVVVPSGHVGPSDRSEPTPGFASPGATEETIRLFDVRTVYPSCG